MFGSRNQLNMPIDVSQTAINELANRPRQDITGERYGNTLSDDMFSIKNPNLPDRHTPESYEYFNQPVVPEVNTQAWEPAAGWNGPLPVLNPNFISRQKFVGESAAPLTVNKDWGLVDDIMEFPEDYTDEQFAWAEGQRDKRETAQRINDLSTEGLRNEQFGNAPTTQSPYRDAEVDTYLDNLVNYDALSPATIEQLVKTGVYRPPHYDPYNTGEPDASDHLMELINAYKWAMENGYR